MKQLLLLLLLLWALPFQIYSMSTNDLDTVTEYVDKAVPSPKTYPKVVDADGDKWYRRIEGVVFERGDGKYCYRMDKDRQFSFRPTNLKTSPYTGESIPFNLEEFAKTSDFKDCELLDFVWKRMPTDSNLGVVKILGSNGVVKAFENDMGYTFLLKPHKKFSLNRDEEDRIYSLAKGSINYYFGGDVHPSDILKVYPLPADKVTENQPQALWHPESRTVEDSNGVSYVLDPNYNLSYSLFSFPSNGNGGEPKKIPVCAGATTPTSISEEGNVLTLKYSNGDYCKFSKLKSYELFECVLHYPFGVLRATPSSDGEGVDKSFECTGKISSGKDSYWTYNGFTADVSSLAMYLNPISYFAISQIKFDDYTRFQNWLFYNAVHNWKLTSTGEKAVWEDGKLITASLKEKMEQEEIARGKKIREDVIASYKTKYGIKTIDNILNGRITIGMPWTLVGSVFPNGLWSSSRYSKLYKVVNNKPQIDYNSKKIIKNDYGLGNLVYVTVTNGKITHITYTNHR